MGFNWVSGAENVFMQFFASKAVYRNWVAAPVDFDVPYLQRRDVGEVMSIVVFPPCPLSDWSCDLVPGVNPSYYAEMVIPNGAVVKWKISLGIHALG